MTTPNPVFWNRIAKRYARKAVPSESIYSQKLATTQSYLQPEHSVLELGCGTGTTALKHAPYVTRYQATDFSEAMIRIAESKAAQQDCPNLHFCVDTLEGLRGADQHFDAVLAMSLLHLLPDLDTVLADIFSLLKPGGYFVSTSTCIAEHAKILRYILPLGGQLGLVPYVNFFTAAQLRKSTLNAGFALIEDWRPPGTHDLFMVAQRPLNS